MRKTSKKARYAASASRTESRQGFTRTGYRGSRCGSSAFLMRSRHYHLAWRRIETVHVPDPASVGGGTLAMLVRVRLMLWVTRRCPSNATDTGRMRTSLPDAGARAKFRAPASGATHYKLSALPTLVPYAGAATVKRPTTSCSLMNFATNPLAFACSTNSFK